MHLCFIGMSGVGKSYWAKQLAQAGWVHFDCDAMIAERLGELISVGGNEDAVHAVGRWMGMPWDTGYADRESQYLSLERAVSDNAIDSLATEVPTIIDTTGSVIYAGDKLHDRLSRATRVVYFDVPDEVRQQMVELYLSEPKPLLWQGAYQPRPGESQADALARCYADLLTNRAERYRDLVDVVIDYHAVREPGFEVSDLLKMIDPAV
ncbi:MAG: AAA family ATPase [Planctomycetota bacterium]